MVRRPARARNDVAVPPRLLQPELSDGTEMLRAIVQTSASFRFCASDACTPRIGNTTICVATATSSPIGDVGHRLDQRHQPGLAHAASRIPRRSSRFTTVETCQRPPRRVSMPRAFSSTAIARKVMCPELRMSSMTGARSRACRSALACRTERRTALASPPERRRAVGVAEPHPAAPGHAQRLLRPLRDCLALGLSHQRDDADGQVVRLRQVDRGKLHPAGPRGARAGKLRWRGRDGCGAAVVKVRVRRFRRTSRRPRTTTTSAAPRRSGASSMAFSRPCPKPSASADGSVGWAISPNVPAPR